MQLKLRAAGTSSHFPSRFCPCTRTQYAPKPFICTPRLTQVVCRSQQPSDHAFTNDWGTVIPESLPTFNQDMDWRDVRAQLVARSKAGTPLSGTEVDTSRWAHEISKPEAGCILVAHPLMFEDRQQYFHQSVILILEHNDETGSWGIILNRPTVYKVKHLQAVRLVMPEFDDCTIHLGGDCGEAQMQLLHTYKLDEAKEIMKGLYLGGVPAARKAIQAGELDASNFRWFVNYAGWRPRQLATECRMGVWFLAAASPALILDLLDMKGNDVTESKSNVQQPWLTVLDTMGGSYRTLADRIRQQRNQTSKTSNIGDTEL